MHGLIQRKRERGNNYVRAMKGDDGATNKFLHGHVTAAHDSWKIGMSFAASCYESKNGIS